MIKKMKNSIPRLGELELEILDRLWRVEETDVLRMHEMVGEARGISANTVGSALERLFRKKLVTRSKVSHAYRYRPVLARDEFHARRLIDAAGGIQKLADEGLLAAFVDAVAATRGDALDQLEALIRRKRAEGER